MGDLRFPKGVNSPFSELKGEHPKATILSELSFGNEGFGSPDGAVYVECDDPTMLFIEVKSNESYAKSCRGNSYNSTIRGQLELKWRMTQLHHSKCHHHNGNRYIKESSEFKAVYGERDDFYRATQRQDEKWLGSWRRLRIAKGVENFLNLLARCEHRCFFVPSHMTKRTRSTTQQTTCCREPDK